MLEWKHKEIQCINYISMNDDVVFRFVSVKCMSSKSPDKDTLLRIGPTIPLMLLLKLKAFCQLLLNTCSTTAIMMYTRRRPWWDYLLDNLKYTKNIQTWRWSACSSHSLSSCLKVTVLGPYVSTPAVIMICVLREGYHAQAIDKIHWYIRSQVSTRTRQWRHAVL